MAATGTCWFVKAAIFCDRSGDGFRPPVSIRLIVQRDTASSSASASCDIGGFWLSRQIVRGCLACISISWHIANLIASAA